MANRNFSDAELEEAIRRTAKGIQEQEHILSI
jgi:hypothetical protein